MKKYAKTHEWLEVDGNKAKIGLSKYAANELGDIVYVSLPENGSDVELNAEFTDVESVKAVSSVYSPVSGKITKVNADLDASPEKINEAPEDTYIIEVEFTEISNDLMTAEQYTEYIKTL